MGDEFLKVSSKIYGQPKQVITVPILPEDGKGVANEKLKKAIAQTDTGEGVLILTDGFGGSPTNICMNIFKDYNCEIVTGLNLSMLLEVLCYQDKSGLKELAQRAISGGNRGIVHASELFRQKLSQVTESKSS